MEVQGISVCKFDDKTFLGVHKTHNVYLCDGKYGEYLRYMDKHYSIPAWAKMENLKEPFGIAHTVKIIDWKMKNPMVPRGEEGCKKIEDPILLGVHNGHDVWFYEENRRRYLKCNGSIFYINSDRYRLVKTLEDAIMMFKWDKNEIVIKKIDIRSGERQRNQENTGTSSGEGSKSRPVVVVFIIFFNYDEKRNR